ncbi:hypothetical protein FRACYDRAFT_246844 [Fragilariopsis cylindrus CCMP1102]|uniref:Uncharacterized protein n=1 Tax=Fragilariopsis cylindrus CCMP1102 TaxID=635003 RepID=A0A1E7EWN7_9STRA|nr:hypothetical protein FRACYDRAFT_246844 [Fragilariopsis cylindrus CCMP1102]|eukprot:OEU10450.1 hypothetical protein FRACYDRAFT_246844 [Fragilariopsis cylindrus CCMP1102]
MKIPMIITRGIILMSLSSSLSSPLYTTTAFSSISNIIQSKYPIIFEQSFQTLTSSSLCWIDKQFDNEFVRLDNTAAAAAAAAAATTVCTHQVDDIEEDPGNDNHEKEEEEEEEQQQQQQQPRNTIIAKVLIRRIIYKCLDKYSTVSSKLEVEEALRYYALPKDLQDELFSKYGGTFKPKTWYDAMNQLRDYCQRLICNNDDLDDDNHNNDSIDGYYKAMLWEHVLNHPITSYVPVQCQSCGHIIPDEYNTDPINSNTTAAAAATADADANIGLTEVEPTFEEQPFVRTGWFRGPRLLKPKVFQLDCPKCKHVSRWYRSRSPQMILNPNRWGRLCGEQEDLRLDLANYLSIDEGIGSFTRIFAICPTPNDCGDITDVYFLKACRHSYSHNKDHNQAVGDDNVNNNNNEVEEESMNRYYQIIDEARRDNTGSKTQSNTVNGYAIHRSKLTATEVSKEIQNAVKDYYSDDNNSNSNSNNNKAWYDIT